MLEDRHLQLQTSPQGGVSPSGAPAAGAERILVVDDTKANRDILRILLKRDGYEIVEAADGVEALDLVESAQPDLVLLDIMMPGMDGFEVCERLKDNAETRDLPVIFLSALSDTDQKVKGLDLGAADYITKPFDKGEVRARVRTHLDLRRLNLSLSSAIDELRRQRDEVEAELADAARIQQSLLPVPNFSIGDLLIEWCIEPCASLGGDFVNIIPLGDRYLALYLGDVSGHGVPSSLITMAVDRALTADGALIDKDGSPLAPGRVLTELDLSYSARSLEKHVTMFYGVVDLHEGVIAYSTAAHPAAVLVRGDRVVSTHELGGSVIGIGGLVPFEDGDIDFQPGDRLVVYTDGVTENQAPNGNFYGEERFFDFLCAHHDQGASQLPPVILEELRQHRQDAAPQDDISIVIIERKAVS